MKRRTFIKNGLAASIGAAALLSGSPFSLAVRSASAACSASGKKLVLIHQHGGNDGVNTCIPFLTTQTSPNYVYAPYPGYKTGPDGSGGTKTIRNAIAIDENDILKLTLPGGSQEADIGFHPAMSAFQKLYNNTGKLAVFPAVQQLWGGTSHFENTYLVQSGVQKTSIDRFQGQKTSGWVNRYMQVRDCISIKSGDVPALALDEEVTQFLRPGANDAKLVKGHLGKNVIVGTLGSSDTLNLGEGDDSTYRSQLEDIYKEHLYGGPHEQLLKNSALKLINDMDVLAGKTVANYNVSVSTVTGNGDSDASDYYGLNSGDANYTGNIWPDNQAYNNEPRDGFIDRLKVLAQLIKDGSVGLELAALTFHGWDFHNGQGGAATGSNYKYHHLNGWQSGNLSVFADGIRAFWRDLKYAQATNHMEHVVILTTTEFGRTLIENGSAGTDHGSAGTWFMLGENVMGGIHHGKKANGDPNGYPNFAFNNGSNDEMYKFLNPTVDPRDIYTAILEKHLGVMPASDEYNFILDGYSPPASDPTDYRRPKNCKPLNVFLS